ncbi:MAG TPA: hypothetical protein ENI62_04310 [Gammaproteobacteria bacterium]|nr:hypothetical protein [Gammaproteobacteria bacterium]
MGLYAGDPVTGQPALKRILGYLARVRWNGIRYRCYAGGFEKPTNNIVGPHRARPRHTGHEDKRFQSLSVVMMDVHIDN